MSAQERMATRIYRGTGFLQQEIADATKELATLTVLARAAAQTLEDKFNAQQPVEIKLAAENLDKVCADVARKSQQIAALSSSMATTFAIHANRHAHIGG